MKLTINGYLLPHMLNIHAFGWMGKQIYAGKGMRWKIKQAAEDTYHKILISTPSVSGKQSSVTDVGRDVGMYNVVINMINASVLLVRAGN